MAWKVDVDLDNLEKADGDLQREINDLTATMASAKELIDTMSNYWEGDAAVAYINEMTKRYNKAYSVIETLQALKTAIDAQIEELKDVDNFFEKLWYGIWHW